MKMIGRIILAWWYWITNRNDAMSRERLQICAKCELRVWFICGECSCPLQAKSRIEDEMCPHPKGNKWGKRMRYLDGGFVNGEVKSRDCK